MSGDREQFPRFFITPPAPCPYLPGQVEQKVFTHLSGPQAETVHDKLAEIGFRRSQTIAYRPRCPSCSACHSVRVLTSQFVWSRSFRRIMAKNEDVLVRVCPAIATPEHYDLFSHYVLDRHEEGGMDEMTRDDFIGMVENTSIETRLIEYRVPWDAAPSASGEDKRPLPADHKGNPDGRLIGLALCDRTGDGWSMVYSCFDPTESPRSMGSFMILERIASAAQDDIPFVYLGFQIDDCQKMSYKTRFTPQERLIDGQWTLQE